MSTTLQDRAFIKDVISETILESAVEWIRKNMDPEEVFREDQLQRWAENNEYEKP